LGAFKSAGVRHPGCRPVAVDDGVLDFAAYAKTHGLRTILAFGAARGARALIIGLGRGSSLDRTAAAGPASTALFAADQLIHSKLGEHVVVQMHSDRFFQRMQMADPPRALRRDHLCAEFRHLLAGLFVD